MSIKFFNVKDFKAVDISASFSESRRSIAMDSACGPQGEYDVFLSHSTKDSTLIKKIRKRLEDDNSLSVYIDWDEDSGTSRDEIANTVKDAMNRSRSFLIVKTYHSDQSSWVSWETGYFDNKDANKIGVLLIEDDDNGYNYDTYNKFEHQEYLKSYELLGQDDIVEFVKNGVSGVKSQRATYNADDAFRNNNIKIGVTGALEIVSDASGTSTKFYGD